MAGQNIEITGNVTMDSLIIDLPFARISVVNHVLRNGAMLT